jgi:hypothetical protein
MSFASIYNAVANSRVIKRGPFTALVDWMEDAMTRSDESLKRKNPEQEMSMKEEFKKATARDTQAAAYFASEDFLNEAERAIRKSLVSRGESWAYFFPAILAKPQDMPYIQESFKKMKEKYPELNHVRFNKGLGAGLGIALVLGLGVPYLDSLVFDTNKNSLGRRIRVGFGFRL